MQTRKPIVAGQFYPAQHDTCVEEVDEYLQQRLITVDLPDDIVAGIVPHAGWAFSAGLAGMVFSAIYQQHKKVHTFVIFGASHSYFGPKPAVFEKGNWITPMGEVAIDEDLADTIIKSDKAIASEQIHRNEHSIEVQVPFIQRLFAGAKILPILVPPADDAIALGESIGGIIKADKNRKIICLGSTDLTHYGPHYGFEPMGSGKNALQWAANVNDKHFIDIALQLKPKEMLASAAENSNACGPGAAAAAVAVAKKLGKTKGILLAHTNSNEIMLEKMNTSSSDSVGYAAMVF
ncbi:MAG: AmmeMemoRadiSam system protein B [Planctomycetota bacterium]|jgi:AmmeMemoRadiSam system protein B